MKEFVYKLLGVLTQVGFMLAIFIILFLIFNMSV